MRGKQSDDAFACDGRASERWGCRVLYPLRRERDKRLDSRLMERGKRSYRRQAKRAAKGEKGRKKAQTSAEKRGQSRLCSRSVEWLDCHVSPAFSPPRAHAGAGAGACAASPVLGHSISSTWCTKATHRPPRIHRRARNHVQSQSQCAVTRPRVPPRRDHGHVRPSSPISYLLPRYASQSREITIMTTISEEGGMRGTR
jgi:hypothetical protein